MENDQVRKEEQGIDFGKIIMRLVVAAIVLAVTAFLTPNFAIDSLWALIVAAIVITVVDYLIERFTGIDASPFGRGIVGFIVAVAIIYFTQYLVDGFEVTLWGAILASLVIGVINAIIPGRAM